MYRSSIAALCIVALSSAAQAQDVTLWELAPEIAEDEGDTTDPGQGLTLNSAAFSLRPGRTASLDLPGGGQTQIRIRSVTPSLTGGTLLTARAVDRAGELHLNHGVNATFGTLVIDGRTWQIEELPGQDIRIRPAPDRPSGNDALTPPASSAQPSVSEPQAGNGVVDLFYVYDQTMVDQYGWGLTDLAAGDVAYLNTAFSSSDVPMSASITDMAFIDLPADRGGFTLLSEIFDQTNGFEGAGAALDRLGADIYSLNRVQVPGRDTFCGIAFILDPTREYAIAPQYNVCHNSIVLAHETGHNLGLAHGLQTDSSSALPVDWARGYMIDTEFSQGGVYASVMSYGENILGTFSDAERPCPERGSVCGIPVGEPNAADASRALREYSVTGNRQTAVPINRLRSAVLPTSRFVATGSPATVFMTVVNPNDVTAEGCRISHHGPDRTGFTYQRTDPATNAAIGDPNTPVDIPARGFQTFVISLTPSADYNNVTFTPFASCANAPMAEVTVGLNTVNLGSDAVGGPDLVALAATINGNGIVDVPAGRRGVFSVATANIGGAGEVTVRARSVNPALPATGEVCQTLPSGACMSPPAESVTLNVGAGETPTFGVFVRTTWPTPFVSRHRFQVQMEVGGAVRGSTSVAIRDAADLQIPAVTNASATVQATRTLSGTLADSLTGYASGFEIVSQPSLGSVTLDTSDGTYTYTAPSLGGTDSFTWRATNASGASQAATVTVNVTALPLPGTTGFTEADDINGQYSVDLDNHATGDIDRFVLTTPPPAPYTFNEISGVLEIDLPESGSDIVFDFRAENPSGQSSAAQGRVQMEAFTNCMPDRATESRMLRRLATFVTDTGGTVSLDEAELLAAHLCLTVANRTDFTVEAVDEARNLTVVFFPEQSRGPQPYYVVNYAAPNTGGQFARFQICKIAGQTFMNQCATTTN
mgnify:CR=1 FL=1